MTTETPTPAPPPPDAPMARHAQCRKTGSRFCPQCGYRRCLAEPVPPPPDAEERRPIWDGTTRPIGRIGAYAPGHYMCKCSTCGETFTGDKRAVNCLNCAIDALLEDARPPLSEGEWVERAARVIIQHDAGVAYEASIESDHEHREDARDLARALLALPRLSEPAAPTAESEEGANWVFSAAEIADYEESCKWPSEPREYTVSNPDNDPEVDAFVGAGRSSPSGGDADLVREALHEAWGYDEALNAKVIAARSALDRLGVGGGREVATMEPDA